MKAGKPAPGTSSAIEADACRATVIARWDLRRAMLQTDGGAVYEAPVAEPDQDSFDVGAEAFVELDTLGRLQRWWLAARPDPGAHERREPRFAR